MAGASEVTGIAKITQTVAANPGGFITAAAGVSTFGLGLFTAIKSETDGHKPLNASMLLKPMGAFIAGGGMLALAQSGKFAANNPFATNILRCGALGLMAASVLQSAAGAFKVLNGYEGQAGPRPEPRNRYSLQLVNSPLQLEARNVIEASAPREGGGVDVTLKARVDTTTAKELPDGTSVGEALRYAQAAAQADRPDYRSYAVIKTEDGHLWTARLTGSLDQIDGPNYAKETSFDVNAADDMTIKSLHPSIVAVSGVDRPVPPRELKPPKPETLKPGEGLPQVPGLPGGRASSPPAPSAPAAPTEEEPG